jgi:hypothetical protein
MGNGLENDEVEQGRNPKDDVKDKGTEVLREHHLPVAHWRGHEWFDRPELKLFRKKPHRDERKNEDKSEPEEHGIKERLLDRILDRPLVHERDLKVEVDPADQEKEDEDDVGNRRIEVTSNFAGKKSEEFCHDLIEVSAALFPIPSGARPSRGWFNPTLE